MCRSNRYGDALSQQGRCLLGSRGLQRAIGGVYAVRTSATGEWAHRVGEGVNVSEVHGAAVDLPPSSGAKPCVPSCMCVNRRLDPSHSHALNLTTVCSSELYASAISLAPHPTTLRLGHPPVHRSSIKLTSSVVTHFSLSPPAGASPWTGRTPSPPALFQLLFRPTARSASCPSGFSISASRVAFAIARIPATPPAPVLSHLLP